MNRSSILSLDFANLTDSDLDAAVAAAWLAGDEIKIGLLSGIEYQRFFLRRRTA